VKARISKAGTFLYSKRVKRYSRDIDIKVIIGPIITSAQEGMIHPAFVCLFADRWQDDSKSLQIWVKFLEECGV